MYLQVLRRRCNMAVWRRAFMGVHTVTKCFTTATPLPPHSALLRSYQRTCCIKQITSEATAAPRWKSPVFSRRSGREGEASAPFSPLYGPVGYCQDEFQVVSSLPLILTSRGPLDTSVCVCNRLCFPSARRKQCCSTSLHELMQRRP